MTGRRESCRKGSDQRLNEERSQERTHDDAKTGAESQTKDEENEDGGEDGGEAGDGESLDDGGGRSRNDELRKRNGRGGDEDFRSAREESSKWASSKVSRSLGEGRVDDGGKGSHGAGGGGKERTCCPFLPPRAPLSRLFAPQLLSHLLCVVE